MNLNEIMKLAGAHKRRKRLGHGRGSGHGKTSGRGTKGQKSRSGFSRRFGFEGGQMPLFRRLPKKGFSNALFKVRYAIVNTGQLNEFDEETTINLEILKSTGLVKKNTVRVKVLAKGTLTRKLQIQADKFSVAAKQMIEAAGGTAEEIAAK